ncbi:hypothetical protein [Chitinophaga silvisoli]|uniref:hypothetical protein n=1 Tax=Chitinophaga silvisoli TaxID=2291814 RepID=UPI0011C11D6A|nr:hypothetical protein [Chitinophaga silvisoli]
MNYVILILLLLSPLIPAYFISRVIFRKVKAAGWKRPDLYQFFSLLLGYFVVLGVIIYLLLINLTLQR